MSADRKPRPAHLIKPNKFIIPRTFCGVNPCRKGVKAFGQWFGKGPVTCKACLRISGEESKK